MKWKIWPRQHGKSYEIMQWWLGDPERRFILCGSAKLAEHRRREVKDEVDRRVSAGMCIAGAGIMNQLLKSHILSIGQWQLWKIRYGNPGLKWQFALDDAEVTIGQLVGANVVLVAGAGRNDEPDPEIKAKAEEHAAKWRHTFPEGYEDL